MFTSPSSFSPQQLTEGLFASPWMSMRCLLGATILLNSRQVAMALIMPTLSVADPKIKADPGSPGGSRPYSTRRIKDLMNQIRTPSPPPPGMKPPPGNGIRKDTIGQVLWANDYPLLLKMDKEVGVDMTDGRGVFVRTYEKYDSPTRAVVLGKLQCNRWMAASRQKLWWMVPSWGDSASQIPEETQFLLIRMSQEDACKGTTPEEETYALIVPMVSGPYRSSIRQGRTDKRNLVLTVESGDEDVDCNQDLDLCFISAGNDPYKLLSDAFKAIADRTQTFKVRCDKVLPPTVDMFGWCTWDAFYTDVHGPGIVQGIQSLAAAGTPAKVLIIDDGWQDVQNDATIWIKENDANCLQAPASWAANIFQKASMAVVKMFFRLGQSIRQNLELYFNTKVEGAPAGSIHILIWGVLANTILKTRLLDHYARRMDYTKRLMSVRASSRFLGTLEGEDLKGFVESLKRDHGIDFVYCWHALLGYWSGVGGEFNEQWKTGIAGHGAAPKRPVPSKGILAVEPQLRWDPLLLNNIGMAGMTSHGVVGGKSGGRDGMRAGAGSLSHVIHRYLKDCGIDGVKVDAQAASTLMGQGMGGSSSVAREYIHKMEQSVVENFGPDGHCINCMCHPAECVFSYKTTNIARASDDFYPRDISSHTAHIAGVAYNSIFLGEVVQPDWDMFQSRHPAALLHAAARAVSGSAVYVSDHPGEHDEVLLRRLVLKSGGILRGILPGRPTKDCLFKDVTHDTQTALKVFNMNPYTGVVGAFNIQGAAWDKRTRGFRTANFEPREVPAVVRPTDVHMLADSPRTEENPSDDQGRDVLQFAVYGSHFTADGFLESTVFSLCGPDDATTMLIKFKEAALFTISPVTSAATPTGRTISMAPIGLVDMFNSGGAVRSFSFSVDEEQEGEEAEETQVLVAKTTMVGDGRFMAYSSAAPSKCTIAGKEVTFSFSREINEDGEGVGSVTVEVPEEEEPFWPRSKGAPESTRDLIFYFE